MSKLILLLLLMIPLDLVAGTADKINKWFENQNYINTTKPGVYEGQTARYATFGGVSTRAAITQPFDLFDLQTPKFSAGCGGIDFYSGGFSAVNADQFIAALRSIGQNAQSLAFMLAIQVVSPQLSGVMNKIQEWANEFKRLSKDSCALATQLVGGTLDTFGAREGNCTVKRMQDFGEDWSNANYRCTNGGEIKSTEAYGGDPNKVDIVKGNLAWYVLMQNNFFKNDLEFSELVMNITGTVIISDGDNNGNRFNTISPSISDLVTSERFQNIIQALLYGQESNIKLSLYRCEKLESDPNGCIRLKNSSALEDVTPEWEGLIPKTRKVMSGIVQKIYNDTALSSEEKGFISTLTIPIHRLLTVLAAYYPKNADFSSEYEEYIKLVSVDILLWSLNSVVSKVDQQVAQLKMADSHKVKKYRDDVQNVLKGIAIASKENNVRADKLLEVLQRIQMYEKTLISRLSSGFVLNANWGSR